MALVHSLHAIRSRSRNKHWNLRVGWRDSSWWPWCWFLYSINYHIHTMYYSCILSDWNKLFLRDLYMQRVGVAATVCRMIRLVFLPAWFRMYISNILFRILYHYMNKGTVWHCALVNCTPSQFIWLFFVGCTVLVFSVIMCSSYYFSPWW